ncbi:MAG: protein DpdG [Polyangiaceae bacterium]
MGILNRASDGLPSVLVVLVRVLHKKGRMKREQLEALVAPPSLQRVSQTFDNGKMFRQTLKRWTQIGLFVEEEGEVALSEECTLGVTAGVEGLRALGNQCRRLVLAPKNNEDLVRVEPSQAADFTRALCWVLAQDPFRLTTGGYNEVISRMEIEQFQSEPWAFHPNSTRWDGFRDWAPLLGFGWLSSLSSSRSAVFIADPTEAVAQAMPAVFGTRTELPESDFFAGLAAHLPVLDGGSYRRSIEACLSENKWRPTALHEVSPTLTLSLFRLQEENRLVLESRSDAPHRTLLGLGFAEVGRVSHLALPQRAS